jgi:hypothetical protein
MYWFVHVEENNCTQGYSLNSSSSLTNFLGCASCPHHLSCYVVLAPGPLIHFALRCFAAYFCSFLRKSHPSPEYMSLVVPLPLTSSGAYNPSQIEPPLRFLAVAYPSFIPLCQSLLIVSVLLSWLLQGHGLCRGRRWRIGIMKGEDCADSAFTSSFGYVFWSNILWSNSMSSFEICDIKL